MARPAKSLHERVRDRSFLARRHGGLLAGALVRRGDLRELQERWQAAVSEPERGAWAREFQLALRSDNGDQRVVPRDVDRSTSGASADATREVDVPVARFFKDFLVHTKGPAAGKPFVLERWQLEFVEDFGRTIEGERVFKRGLLGVARGNGKSPIAAGLAIRELVTRDDSPDVILAAASRDQARIVFAYASGFIEAGPLSEVLEVGRHEIRCPRNGGVLRTVSADGFVAHGLNPSAVIIDEAHSWNTTKQHELFAALDTAIHKRPGAFWLIITTAGHDKESLLGRLHRQMLETLELERRPGLVIGRDEFSGVLLHWFGADEECDADDEHLWRAVNPAKFVRLEDLRRQRRSPSMGSSTFKRLHLNAWVAPDRERWLQTERWQELAEPGLEIAPDASICIGMDGSRTYDCTAIAWASPADDGRVDVDCRVFAVREDVPHHELHRGKIDFDRVEEFVLELFGRYAVREVAFDPRYLERSAELIDVRISESAIIRVEPFSKHMREALGSLERGVIDGTVRHSGDPVIAQHLEWAGVDRWDNGEIRRVHKLDRSRPIDAVIALALAYWRVQAAPPASVYETRGMLSF